MKKTLTTNGGKAVTFYVEGNNVKAECDGAVKKVGFVYYDEDSRYEIEDYDDVFGIDAKSNASLEACFDAFCEDYLGQLNIREVKRAEFIKRLEKELEAYKGVSLVEHCSDTFEAICDLVEKNADDADF